MYSEQPFPLQANFLCDDLHFAWEHGWLDSFSPRHFLIRAIKNDFSEYRAYKQTTNNSPGIYRFTDRDFCTNFCVNFSVKIRLLRDILGEKVTRRFFEDQISAGKHNYDEAQFFRALSEIELIRHYCRFNNQKVRTMSYEPPLGLTGQNPEFRIEYENNYVVDIEVKTPGFDNIKSKGKVIVPAILLSDKGREELTSFCKQRDIECVMPRVLKLKDRINEAVDKFQEIQCDEHFNLLFINWTFSDFASQGYLEAYSLLANDINGIFTHKEHGLTLGIRPEVYSKISAIIIYSSPIETIVFQDFRYLWATRAFAILPNPYLAATKLNKQKLIMATGMDSEKNMPTPYVLTDMKGDESIETIVASTEICSLIKKFAKNN